MKDADKYCEVAKVLAAHNRPLFDGMRSAGQVSRSSVRGIEAVMSINEIAGRSLEFLNKDLFKNIIALNKSWPDDAVPDTVPEAFDGEAEK